jgi:hypothetical protein
MLSPDAIQYKQNNPPLCLKINTGGEGSRRVSKVEKGIFIVLRLILALSRLKITPHLSSGGGREGYRGGEGGGGTLVSVCIVYYCQHKVLTYVEYRAVSGVFQNIDHHPASVSSPAPKLHTRRAVRGVGVNILEDVDIGLAFYSIISVRLPTTLT